MTHFWNDATQILPTTQTEVITYSSRYGYRFGIYYPEIGEWSIFGVHAVGTSVTIEFWAYIPEVPTH